MEEKEKEWEILKNNQSERRQGRKRKKGATIKPQNRRVEMLPTTLELK